MPQLDPRFKYSRQNTNTTGTLKSGKGVLKRVVIGVKGATANVLTLYDNTTASGTVIANIDTTVQPGDYDFDIVFDVGLSFQIATGTAADVTIVYL